jgi:Tol biopolymer transport system component
MEKIMLAKTIQSARRHPLKAGWLLVGLLCLAATGCGGGSGADSPIGSGGSGGGGSGSGSGGGSGSGPGGGVAGLPLLYIADQDAVERYELFLVDSGNPGAPVKLNSPLPAGGAVDDFLPSPTGAAAAYIADQDIVGRSELYLVDLAEPGQSTKVNTPMPFGSDVRDFTFSPDGSRIVYRADQETDGAYELYLVDVAHAGTSTKLSAPLTTGGWVRSGFAFSPDGTQVLYRADQDEPDVTELFLVDIAVPGVSTQVNPSLTAGGNVSEGFAFSLDGQQIGYVADQDSDGTLELYAVTTAMPGVSSKLNGPLVQDGDVCRFRFSHDSSRVAYCADQETDGVLELYTVQLVAPGMSVKLNPPLTAGGEVTTGYEFSPDSGSVAYMADQDADDVIEVYIVDVAAPGVTTTLSGPMTGEGDAWFFRFNPEGTHLTYIADQEADEVYELYDVDLADAGVITKLNAPTAGSGVYEFQYSPDETQVFYTSAEDTEFAELYRIDLASPGASTKLNAELVAGGEVWDFDVLE